ncbi:Protein of unknown function [Pyronema omphalodes CBS 100304]|uniref:CTF/NF-I domain-containing protein n=1 Tax=Pyronema omphalodes (strain CBS 100304) TaxID=1076935 RepID=U4LLI0_PYROM|nr:Protein of unknown function [Pyronema omphalodes CBS 100304]
MAALGSVLCSRSCVFLTDSIQISPPYTGPEMTQLIYDVLLWIDTHWSELGPISSDPPPRNFEGLISTFKDFRKHITSTDVDVDTRAQFTVILDQIERVNLLFNHYWDTTFIISTPLDRIKQYRDDFKQGVLGEMIQGRDLSNPLRPATLKYIDTVLVWIEDNIKEYYPQKTIPTDDDVMYLLFITPCSDGRGITEAMKILMQIVRIKAFVEYYQQRTPAEPIPLKYLHQYHTEEEKKSREENRQKAIDKMLAVNKRRPGNAGINEPNYTEPYAKPTDEPPNASVQFTTINW